MIELAAVCLAANIYFEARGEPISGQMAVAHVTLKRAKGDTNQVCNQVLRHKQFSWLNGKVSSKQGVMLAAFAQPTNQKAWRKAYGVAYKVLKKKTWDNTGGATHYHAKSVKPKWAHGMKVTAVIGDHIFYKRIV